MRKTARLRSVVSLIAAYALALQGLLLPISVATAAPLAGVNCLAAQGGHSSPAQQTACICAATCAGCCADLGPPPVFTVATVVSGASGPLIVQKLVPLHWLAIHGPQIPRAPPLA